MKRRERWNALRKQIGRNWQIFARNRLALLGLLILIGYSLAPPIWAQLRATTWRTAIYDPVTAFDINFAPHPSPPSWVPVDRLPEDSVHRFDQGRPSYVHLLGTDTLGRDILAVLLASTGHSFIVGITAALTTAAIGIITAAYAAYYRGWIDTVIGFIADAFLLLPAPIFMVAVGAYMRAKGTSSFELIYQAISGNTFTDRQEFFFQPLEFGLVYGVIAGLGAASILLRSHGLKVMALSFIEASRVAGAGARQIIWGHLVPHLAPLAIVYMLVSVTGAVVADGFLSFLGLNPDPLNWGTMIYNSFTYSNALSTQLPWNAILAPAIAISAFAGAFYLISRGVQDIIEPRQRSTML